MSAIWGAIDLANKPIPKEISDIFLTAYQNCILDQIKELHQENCYFGCGIQYFTPEAHLEKLPDQLNKTTFFTADVVLDNRTELVHKYPSLINSVMPDGEMLFHIIHSHGCNAMNDLLGAFSFVYYNKESNSIFLSTDAVGARCLYYMQLGSTFYFSTLMEPLIQILSAPTLNERWLTDFLAMDHLFMINETKETPIKEILRLAPSEFLTISTDHTENIIYWNPFESFEELKLASDNDYKKRFNQLWDNSVKSMIRSQDPVSILLSGGLDSTAVAAIAAPYLKEQKRTLYSYTSVPMKGYTQSNDNYYIEDETEDVLKTVEYYQNIQPTFIDLDGNCAWDLMEKEFHDIEIPFKSIQNFLWIAESCRQAYSNHSRIMLTGSYGNTSISYTDLNVYMNDIFMNHKNIFKKELKAFSSSMGFPYSFAFNEIKNSISKPFEDDFYPFKHSFVNRVKASELKCSDRISSLMKINHDTQLSYETERKQRLNWLAMRQIGEVTTKHSLYTGVLLRDPTRSKPVIEFCLSLPLNQFCKQGLDRRLVKEYLKDIIPPHVIRFSKQGKQSSDLTYRFQKNWNTIRTEWISIYEKYYNSTLVDSQFAKQQLEEQPKLGSYKAFDLVRHMYTIQVLEYENRFRPIMPYSSVKKMEQPLISIIVPVYQSVNELDRCIFSILNQTYRNLEIILVDDGSTDGSSLKCDEFQKLDSRIHVIHQKNGGVASARNTGLTYAHGSFIGFVDSDDWIDPEMYTKLYTLICNYNADISSCSFEQIEPNHTIHLNSGYLMVYHENEMLDALVSGHDCKFFSPAVWNKLFKKEVISNLIFDNYQIGEDYLFLIQALKRIKKGVFLEKEYYHYIKKENSLTTQTNNPKKIKDYINASTKQLELLPRNISSASLNTVYYNYYCILLNNYCLSDTYKNSKSCRKLLSKELRRLSPLVREQFKIDYKHGRQFHYELLLSTFSPYWYKQCLRFEKTKVYRFLRKLL